MPTETARSVAFITGLYQWGEGGVTKGGVAVSRNASRGSSSGQARPRLGLIRRGRMAGQPPDARPACPVCGLPNQDPVAARLGFCPRCSEFTGMCGAGRTLVSPDMMTVTSWHMPCTKLGVIAWRISQRGNLRTTLLCSEHDAQLRAGDASWIRDAIPVADAPGA
jgi:hypothetical protein